MKLIESNQELANKVYSALYDKCENDFQGKAFNEWREYLKPYQIEVRDYDHVSNATNDLIDIINSKEKGLLICDDPFSAAVDNIGGFQMLFMSEDVALKIAVLQPFGTPN